MMGEIGTTDRCDFDDLLRRFHALKTERHKLSDLQGVVIEERIGGKIPEIDDLRERVKKLMPKERVEILMPTNDDSFLLDVPFLLYVSHGQQPLYELMDRLTKLEKVNGMYLRPPPINPEVLLEIAKGQIPVRMLLEKLLVSPLNPVVEEKESTPIDWPARQKELAEQHRVSREQKRKPFEWQSRWAAVTNWLSRWWYSGSTLEIPLEDFTKKA